MASEKQLRHLRKLADSRRGKKSVYAGENHPFYGRKHSDETKEKLRDAATGRVMDEETRKKMSANRKGSKHHNWKGGVSVSRGYRFITKPDHPRANCNGYVREHIIVMEESIGRYITDDECVHHINKDTLDNRIDNLQLMTKKEHALLHSKTNTKGRFKKGRVPWNKKVICAQD